MAISNPSGLTINYQQTGIQYSKITDSSADWSSISNSTYFYDRNDKLVHYKDSTGTVLEIFSSAGSSSFTGGTITGPTTFTGGLTANTISATTYYNLPTGSNLTYMFDSVSSDISTYSAATSISSYVVGALATKTTNISTTPTLMGVFATPSEGLGITYLPPSVIVSHYETQKASGANNYYTYYEIYKRTSGGTETLIGTSDNSSSSAVNTSIQNTLSCTITTGTTLNTSDRIVVKIYGTMLSSTANVDLIYADNTNARIEIPIVVAGGTWNGGTVTNSANFTAGLTTTTLTVSGAVSGATQTQSLDNIIIASKLFMFNYNL